MAEKDGMKNKILLALLNSEDSLSMSQIAEKIHEDIQLCNYHLKKMVADNVIVCIQEGDTRKYGVHDIIRKSTLYDSLFVLMTLAVPEFYKEVKNKEVTVECIKQVLLQVLNDMEKEASN